jgi:polysaccharide biosynthesis transport protein
MSIVRPSLLPPDPDAQDQAVVAHSFRPADLDIDSYGPPANSLEYADEVQRGSLIDYWRILYGRKGTLIALAAAGVLAGVLVTLPQSPTYQARTSIEIQDLNQEFLNMKLVSPVADSSSMNALTDIQTQVKILQSESLIERALDKLNISSLSALNPQKVEMPRWRRILNLPPEKKVNSRNELIKTAARNLKVSVAGQTRIIEVGFESTNPTLASGFANAMASEFIEQNMQARWQISQRTSAWLGQQLDDLRIKLQHSDDALQAYARQKGLIYTGDKQNVSEEKLRQLQAEVSRAQADRFMKESRFEIARTAAPDTLPDVLNDSNLRALQTNLTDLRRQEAELATTFKADYSKAKRVRAQITALDSALDHERAAIVNRIKNDFQEAQHRERLLSAAYNSQVRLVTQDSEKSIQYNILKREVDINRQIYEAMLQRVKESSIASAMRASNIRVIDQARPPEQPYKPNLPFNSAVGMLCGVMFGVVAVVTRARTDCSLHAPGDAGRLLGLRELGVIPSAGSSRNTREPSIVTLFPKGGYTVAQPSSRMVTWQNMPSGLADSFRAVLASIIFSRDKDRQHVLVITSASPNEGKTTAATNLAVALANIGQKVLLIDGDIRKPCVHEVFRLNNTTGLTDLLNQRLLDESAANAAVQNTDVPNLHALTSGPALQTGCDLLFSASMPRLIAHYRTQFDMIIIDTPPMLHIADARVLGRMSDAVVLVARAGRTMRAAVSAAFERLVQDHTPVLGIILNDWNPKSSPDSYYGNYTDSFLNKYGASR